MITSLIVAAADNNVIGIDNKIPWHIPADFAYFKKVTTGKPCIMGRKTYESILDILGKPLPGRESLVISRSNYNHEGCHSFGDISSALDFANTKLNAPEIMIIGGAQIYNQALDMNLIDRIYLTRVHQTPDGDAFFPELDQNKWMETSNDPHDGYSFLMYEKKN